MTKHKFTKGQILTDKYDSVLKYEILAAHKINFLGDAIYKVRKFSKYGEHGIKEISEEFFANS